LTRAPDPVVETPPLVGAEPGEERQIVGPGQHVHRVELNDPDGVDHLAEMAHVDTAGGPRPVEPPGGEGESTRLIGGDDSHEGWHPTPNPGHHESGTVLP